MPHAGRVAPGLGAIVSLALVGWLLSHAYWPAGGGLDRSGGPLGRDFINAWIAPYLATHGQEKTLLGLHEYSQAASDRFGVPLPNCYWSYPPITLLLYLPFSVPPYFIGLALWTILGLGALLAAYRSYSRKTSWEWVMLLLAPACIINALSGQNGFWSAALMVGGLLSVRRYPKSAGVAIGLLTFKPQLGLILPFALLAMRAWRTIAVAALTLAILIGASIAVFGTAVWSDYWNLTTPFEMGFLYHFQGMYAAMMLSPFAGLRRIGLPYFDALALQIVISIVVIVLTMKGVRKTDDIRRQTFIILSAMPLVTPYIFNYDMVALSVPLTCALWRETDLPRWKIPVYLLAWLTPLLSMFVALSGYPLLQAAAPLVFAAVFACNIGPLTRIPKDAYHAEQG